MISRSLYALETSLRYIKDRPQILFGLFLLIILPIAFLYTSNQFLAAGQANTKTLIYQRIGLLNDVFASLALESNFDVIILQRQIEETTSLNSDITKFRVVVDDGTSLTPIAALDSSIIGIAEENRSIYEKSFSEPTGITFPFSIDGKDIVQSFRAVKKDGNLLGYIFIETDQTALNSLINSRERAAYYTLGLLYLFLIFLVYWLYKLTDYQKLYRETKEANEMKDLFTNMIAHELRAPLTAIRGYASMLEQRVQDPEDIKYSIRTKESAERLIAIVNDLLDVARIQSGKLSVESEELNVSEVIVAVTDELRISAEEKNIGLTHTGTDETRLVTGDQKRLHQAITNLVSNAIKYTKEGSIELEVIDKRDVVEVRVKDTGMGISAEDQRQLFAPFFRVQSDDVSQITGTGLGMWITKQLIELMGATVGVESIKGVGTHIVVTLNK